MVIPFSTVMVNEDNNTAPARIG